MENKQGISLQGRYYRHHPPENPLGLAEEEIELQHRTRRIRVRMRGDEVVAMDNFGADLTFFDGLD